ncbi:acyltransferase family protein [Candidatus Nitrotoga fabula]|uniref:acyltransferase family protein n=1 Tax=Candidatus Nitrotoga fabula TaxID=2182327 RepID=UPI003B969A08
MSHSTILFANLENGTFRFAEFYARRIRRIFPALILVLMACFVFGWLVLLADEYKQLGKHIAGGAGFVSNFLYWNEAGYFDSAAETKPLLHLWSLGIEEQFYIVWPLMLWAAWKKKFNLFYIAAFLGGISLYFNMQGAGKDAVAAFYSPQTRFWELLCGSLLAWLTLHNPSAYANAKSRLDAGFTRVFSRHASGANGSTLNNVQSLLGSLLLAFGFWRITKEIAFPGGWALLPTLGATFIIAAGAQAWINRTILSSRMLVWFGLISFPLYLWHWPLLSFARILESETPDRNIRIAAVVLAVALAWLTYRAVEKPLRFGKHAQAKTIALVVLMFGIACAGYITYLRDGLLFRKIISSQQNTLVRQLSEITDVWKHYDSNWRWGKCLSPPNTTAIQQKIRDCVDSHRPLVFLWGDSYAAALYPGLLKLQKDQANSFGIAQFTNTDAPPFFDKNKKVTSPDTQSLYDINSEKLHILSRIQPSIVLLTCMYNGKNGIKNQTQLLAALVSTHNRIKSVAPDTTVIFIGPVPHWKGDWQGSLKDAIIEYAKSHRGRPPPAYTNYSLRKMPKELDSFLKNELAKLNIQYVSAYDALCREDGCLTRVGDTSRELTAIDWGHLTAAGSEFLINQIRNDILEKLKKH